MPLLSEIEFGALAVYSPRAEGETAILSRQLRTAVKEDRYLVVRGQNVRVIPRMVSRLREHVAGSPLEDLFADHPVLVPAPRSSLIKKDTLYPAKVICEEMHRQGFGSEVRVWLERQQAVRKAATAPQRERPNVQHHYESLGVDAELTSPASILVVDDIVTSGGMLAASVSRLQETFPEARVRAFALIRTMSDGDIDRIYELCVGRITRNGTRCHREP